MRYSRHGDENYSLVNRLLVVYTDLWGISLDSWCLWRRYP